MIRMKIKLSKIISSLSGRRKTGREVERERGRKKRGKPATQSKLSTEVKRYLIYLRALNYNVTDATKR